MTSELTKGSAELQKQETDIIFLASEYPVAVMFGKSTSPNYGTAIELAKLANIYSEKQLGKSTIHMAAFSKDRVQISRAAAIIKLIRSLKSTQIYTNGILAHDTYHITDVMACYLQSQMCDDWKAYCFQSVDSPIHEDARDREIDIGLTLTFLPGVDENRYLFPCQYLSRYIHTIRLYKNHPSSLTNQIQAEAVKRGCDWCPNFNPAEFKKI